MVANTSTISIAGKDKKVVQGAAAFAKGIAVLQMILDAKEPPTLNQLVKYSGMTRPTMHRILKALSSENLVVSGPGKTYKLGARLIQFSAKALEQNELARIAAPHMDWLASQTRETIHVGTIGGNEMIYLAKRDSPQIVRIATSPGGRILIHASAIGKAMLAFLPEAQREEMIDDLTFERFTEHTLTDADALRQQVAEIRELGYAVSNEESHNDIFCFAAPVFDHMNQVIGSLSISVPKFRLDPNQRVYILPLLKACTEISSKIGARER